MARPLIEMTVIQGNGGAQAQRPAAPPATPEATAPTVAPVTPHPDSAHAAQAMRPQHTPQSTAAPPSLRATPSSHTMPPPPLPPHGVTPHPDSLHAGGTAAAPAPMPPPPPPPPTVQLVGWQSYDSLNWLPVAGATFASQVEADAWLAENRGLPFIVIALPVGMQP